MRSRSKRIPVSLLLVGALAASAAAHSGFQKDVRQVLKPRDVAQPKDYTKITSTSRTQAPTTKPDVGTKDAPVDGLDGKPHAGPWVDTTPDEKKKPVAERKHSTSSKKALPTSLAKVKDTFTSQEGWELIPEKNHGVMDDRNRLAPKKGTTGTEGGVSEKDKTRKAQEGRTGEKTEKKPDPPKEAPPLHHSEQEKISKERDAQSGREKADREKLKPDVPMDKPKGAVGLEKPTDLPERPHDIPHPAPDTPSLPKPNGKDQSMPLDAGTPEHPSPLRPTMPYTEGVISPPETEDDAGLIQPLHSFILSLTMILFSEIGDKTFLVAALMAMRHPRLVVFSAALSALIAMTVLSAVLGHALPSMLPKRLTAFAAALLFLVFGAKMLREGLRMPRDSGVGEEMREVEAELEEKEHLARKAGHRHSSLISPYMLEAGRGRSGSRSTGKRRERPQSFPSSSDSSRTSSPSGERRTISSAFAGLNNLFSLLLSPAWVQTFIMTFLGEWGDRSQIATIAMAAGQDYWWVTGGAISGHAMCTAVAVIGGRALAGRVSLRVVTLGGAAAFIVFGVIYLLEAAYSD
ncbi:GCR1-dependent translation factor 1 [Elasticomyces elasticus]|nr:GCR1-dependent translation factor 1 [Elasticomyces elasticus]